MKKYLITLILANLFTSCNLFVDKEQEAIEICQKAKVQFQSENALSINTYGIGINGTWLDYANMIAKRDSNKKYDWHAKITADNKFYIVSFTDPDDWGYRWEVDIDQKIVKNIDENDYLIRKYDFSRFNGNEDFEVIKVEKSELKLEKHYNYFDNSNSSEVLYVIKAAVLNKTSKIITSSIIDGELKLIFKDKTIRGKSNYESGFKSIISEKKPWEPNTTKEFYIKTKGIDKIYLNYVPEYVVFDISLKAEDPVGFSINKDIADLDLLKNWKKFKNNPIDNYSNNNLNKSKSSLKNRNKLKKRTQSDENVDKNTDENLENNLENDNQ